MSAEYRLSDVVYRHISYLNRHTYAGKNT